MKEERRRVKGGIKGGGKREGIKGKSDESWRKRSLWVAGMESKREMEKEACYSSY